MHSHSDLTWPYITGEIYVLSLAFSTYWGNVIAKKSWFEAQLVHLAYTYTFLYYKNKKIKEIKMYIKQILFDKNYRLEFKFAAIIK